MVDRQPFEDGPRERVEPDEDRQAERQRDQAGAGTDAQHPHDQQQQDEELRGLKAAEGDVVAAARQVVDDLVQAPAKGAEIAAVVELRRDHVAERSVRHRRELRERVAELHGDVEEKHAHQRAGGQRARVRQPSRPAGERALRVFHHRVR